jgi:phage shock protein A
VLIGWAGGLGWWAGLGWWSGLLPWAGADVAVLLLLGGSSCCSCRPQAQALAQAPHADAPAPPPPPLHPCRQLTGELTTARAESDKLRSEVRSAGAGGGWGWWLVVAGGVVGWGGVGCGGWWWGVGWGGVGWGGGAGAGLPPGKRLPPGLACRSRGGTAPAAPSTRLTTPALLSFLLLQVRNLQAQVEATEGLLSKERSANKELAAAGDALRQELGGEAPWLPAGLAAALWLGGGGSGPPCSLAHTRLSHLPTPHHHHHHHHHSPLTTHHSPLTTTPTPTPPAGVKQQLAGTAKELESERASAAEMRAQLEQLKDEYLAAGGWGVCGCGCGCGGWGLGCVQGSRALGLGGVHWRGQPVALELRWGLLTHAHTHPAPTHTPPAGEALEAAQDKATAMKRAGADLERVVSELKSANRTAAAEAANVRAQFEGALEAAQRKYESLQVGCRGGLQGLGLVAVVGAGR